MLLCLAALSGIDLKIRKIPVLPVVLLGVLCSLYRLWCGSDFWELIVGTVPGLLLLGVSVCTKESIGLGDGMVLLVLGMFCGARRAVAILGMALVLAAVLAMVLLILKRAGRKTELPFLPCLCGGYLLCILW